MKHGRLLLLIFLIALASIFVDVGRTIPIKFEIGKFKVNKTIERPVIDWQLLGGRFYRDLEFKKGLDLAGGAQLVLSADMSKLPASERNSALESLAGIIERRINFLGVSEPLIQTAKTAGDYRLIVEIAGITDVNEALSLVGKTAELSFREEISASDSAKVSTIAAQLYGPFQIITNLTGKDLKKADPAFDPQTGEPIIQLSFNSEGEKKFEDLTKKNLGKRLAIFLDNQILMAPTVQGVIAGGKAVITGQFTAAQTKEMSILLNSGALPAPVRVIQQKTIGATLGAESIQKSLIAGLVGIIVLFFFMVGNYKYFGVLASFALLIYALISLAIFKLIPVTLTLAGIAGFILSIGMAVDANILIFERIKKELRSGRTKMSAIDLGFNRAFPSIRDSNMSSLITCAILYWLGTGPVRGFALTLAIGIGVSLFTAITVTKTFLKVFNKEGVTK